MAVKGITALYVLLLSIIIYLANHREYYGVFAAIRAVSGGDKLGHFLLMGLFSYLVNVSLRSRILTLRSQPLLLGSVIVYLAVTLEEFSQICLRHRSFDLLDLFCDYAGIWLFGRVAALHCSRIPGSRMSRG